MLTKLLETACAQTLTASEYEVIIVDNASTDNTRSLVESFSQRYTHVRYILEERLGASHARNRGWRDAKGQYIAFTDDDCRLPQDWLAKAKKIVIERSLDIFGGPYYSCFETTKPRWFRNTYCSLVHFEKTKKLNKFEELSAEGNLKSWSMKPAGFCGTVLNNCRTLLCV